MGGLQGDPTLRKEVKNDYKKGQSHERRDSMRRIRRHFANIAESFLQDFDDYACEARRRVKFFVSTMKMKN